MTKKVMRLVDRQTGLVECRMCGSRHVAMLRTGGKYRRGNWQCRNGCKSPAWARSN